MIFSTVYLNGQKFDAVEIPDNPSHFTEVLARAKELTGHGVCGCNDQALRLVIRKTGRLYRLNLWPYEGQFHDRRCNFYRTAIQESVADGFVKQSIVDTDDGYVSISPDFDLSLTRSQNTATSLQTGPEIGSQRSSRRKATLTALLQFLWDRSGCNSIKGRQATFSGTTFKLWNALSLCRVRKTDFTSVSFMPGMSSKCPTWLDDFEKRMSKSNGAQVVYGVILGKLKGVRKTMYGFSYELQGFGFPLYLEVGLHQQLLNSYAFAFSAVRDMPELNVFLAAQVERSPTGNYRIRNCGFIVTSRDFIPVDSLYEVMMANMLVDQQRTFYKPLKVEDGLLPDFVLMDTPTPTYIEVWGMCNDDYDLRRAEKVKAYAALNHQLIEWDAARNAPMPSLPPKDCLK